jgi:hypothetical protein
MYINGVVANSTPLSDTNNWGQNGIYIGVDVSTTYMTGYISNLRVLKGTGLYPNGTTFTPQTSPLTAITNTLLLTCQSNRLTDASNNAFAITKTGDVSIQRFSPFLPTANASPTVNGGSAYFDGTGDHLTVLETFSLPTSTTPFTMEAWIYFPANTGLAIASTNYSSGAIPFVLGMGTASSGSGITLGLTPCLTFFNGSSWAQGVTSSISIVLNTWNHVAGVFDGANAKIYVNGVLGGTWAAGTWTTGTQANFHIGRRWDTFADVSVTGYISDFRLVIGTAVYTGNFTPPTAPLLVSGTSSIYTSTANVNTTFAAANTTLLMNFTDAAITDATTTVNLETVGDAKVVTANSKFGGSSMFFDGTGDALPIPYNPVLNFDTGNFTIEFWIYVTATPSAEGYFFSIGPAGSGSANRGVRIASHNGTAAGIYFYPLGVSAETLLGSFPSANVWHHIAIVRNGATITGYVDGTALGTTINASTTAITAISSGDYSFVGGLHSSGSTPRLFYNGYIDDLRVTKGIARYTGNFTVSANASPLR